MPEPFDAFQYFQHLRARWKVVAVACFVAAALALAVSWLLPAKYTATARVFIDSPAARGEWSNAMSISPVYLDSLDTYVEFAKSDTLFAEAVKELGLDANQSPAALKQAALRVRRPRTLKILEISATLPDARQAQALAALIADKTVALARETNEANEAEQVAAAMKGVEDAKARLAAAERKASEVRGHGAASGASADESEAAAAEVYLNHAERRAAEAMLQAAANQLAEVQSHAVAGGERLRIIDRGIVPQQPDAGDLQRYLIAGILAALILSILYLTIEFSLQSRKAESLRRELRVAGRG